MKWSELKPSLNCPFKSQRNNPKDFFPFCICRGQRIKKKLNQKKSEKTIDLLLATAQPEIYFSFKEFSSIFLALHFILV